ncbi:MAG: hypothetical protein Q7U75_20055, partial [Desulfobacterales bacterium]|nr:hypothetical protein [Desulfobacterales bacterium]
VWTQVAGAWRSTDSTFTTTAVRATLTTPAAGATGVSLMPTFQWTSVPGAQAYVLYVGTAAGARDVLETSETAQTSYTAVTALPEATALHARVWTQVAGAWRSTDSTFTTTAVRATLTTPANAATDVEVATYEWTGVPGAQAYVLELGTTVGGRDLLKTLETGETSYPAVALPGGETIFARLWTLVGGIWRSRDSYFVLSPASLSYAPRFLYPTHGAITVDLSNPFAWTRAEGADAYCLWVGTSVGASDLLNSGSIAGTSFVVADIPSGQTLYARIWSRVAGNWTRFSDITFTLASSGFQSTIVFPADGAQNVANDRPFEWSESHLAQAYRLTIGTATGGSELHDSGEVRTIRRVVDNLPTHLPLYGRVYTKADGQWFTRDFTFSLAS